MFRRLLAALGLSSSSNPTPPAPATSSAPEELSASAIMAETVSGSHVLTIDGYSQTKELFGTGEYTTSRPFTVGYFPNGKEAANADCVSIYIKLEKDSRDFKARVKFSLLDKDGDPVPRYSCPRGSGSGKVWTFNDNQLVIGSSAFIQRTALEASDYLQDDCFRIRCDVFVFQEMRTEDRDAAAGAIVVPSPDLGEHLETSPLWWAWGRCHI
ncbi:hypothetical protein PR202_gb13388 [Eleusine coracana subsp. coracana]|uniref:MATH domain-containing protein n=1 Tax=Eleusine coracana subsp. coracana TaxID=191504 RepID=A0AAV5ETX7_ELECO|nr:hypothetical protein PR202_gb13388 [Eleusine coracana subsp. coracana]